MAENTIIDNKLWGWLVIGLWMAVINRWIFEENRNFHCLTKKSIFPEFKYLINLLKMINWHSQANKVSKEVYLEADHKDIHMIKMVRRHINALLSLRKGFGKCCKLRLELFSLVLFLISIDSILQDSYFCYIWNFDQANKSIFFSFI